MNQFFTIFSHIQLYYMTEFFSTFSEYIALYPYSSSEPGDLTFTEGEEIVVSQKDGEWWTGRIGDRSGIFPSNYVKPKDHDVRLPKCSAFRISFFPVRDAGFQDENRDCCRDIGTSPRKCNRKEFSFVSENKYCPF